MIPKIIHYCWLSDDPYPEELIKYMNTWRQKLPDYEFILWNFKRFDKESSKWVQQAFDNKKYAFAADYIRLYAIYNYGGIYLDMDIEVIKSFTELLSDSLMLAYEDKTNSGIEAGCFGAEKGNPLIKKCLDYYVNREFVKQDGSFDTIPLPKIMNNIIKKSGYSGRIYSMDYFTCKSNETGIISISNDSYAIHNFAGSWLTKNEKRLFKEKEWISKNVNSIFLQFILKKICVLKKIICESVRK